MSLLLAQKYMVNHLSKQHRMKPAEIAEDLDLDEGLVKSLLDSDPMKLRPKRLSRDERIEKAREMFEEKTLEEVEIIVDPA